ncbi:MAG: CPBP family intramembrane metalloprotease [Spirochaetes bacterium]|nr:CPBP family intramembrane metalloprotease [Spirochaetota bacterium]
MLYLIFSIIAIMPLFFFDKTAFISSILNLLIFKINFYSIIIVTIAVCLILIYDFFEKYSLFLKEKLLLFENIFGPNPLVIETLIISLLSGFFEELLFRGYLYFFSLFIFKFFISDTLLIEFFSILIISIIFGLFHVVQGVKAFLFSILISIVFFISINLSNTLYYAIFSHAFFNFIEIKFIYTYKIEKFIKKSSNFT